ncbi:hypothetical protein M8818_003002 [Zalaria obscura]|uniref:Uncharacterized protein n=1 Tax=Zalaria obscura TaxID=2024903 RepID=A0ACC3SFP4_9PEZI
MSKAALTKARNTPAKSPLSLTYAWEPCPPRLHCAILPVTRAIIHNPNHPLNTRIKERLSANDRNTLRWLFICPAGFCAQYKHVIQAWSKRRMRAAFRKALEERGFDDEGRLLGTEANNGAAGKGKGERKYGIKGALRVNLTPEVVVAKPEEVMESARWLVKKVEMGQEGGPGGSAYRNKHALPKVEKSQESRSGGYAYRDKHAMPRNGQWSSARRQLG